MKMKKLHIIYMLLAGILFLSSCAKDEIGPMLSDNPVVPVLTTPASGSLIMLTEAEAATLVQFEWTAADYGFDAAVTYTVQIDKAGNDFTKGIDLFKSTGLTGSVAYGVLNNMLVANGFPDGVASDIMVRVKASISSAVPLIYSAPVSVAVQPYLVVINYPFLRVPGSYQGWDPSNVTTIIYSMKSDNKYEGYMWFADAGTEFKYTETPDWSVNWGDTGADGTLDASGDNLKAGDAGMYKLNVNLNDKTHQFVKTDWGLIGSATAGGWDTDVNMTWDATNGVLTVTVDLVVGDIKFRANDDWAINLGDNDTNLSLEYGGSDIPVGEAGNYTITLILKGPGYTYSVKKN